MAATIAAWAIAAATVAACPHPPTDCAIPPAPFAFALVLAIGLREVGNAPVTIGRSFRATQYRLAVRTRNHDQTGSGTRSQIIGRDMNLGAPLGQGAEHLVWPGHQIGVVGSQRGRVRVERRLAESVGGAQDHAGPGRGGGRRGYGRRRRRWRRHGRIRRCRCLVAGLIVREISWFGGRRRGVRCALNPDASHASHAASIQRGARVGRDSWRGSDQGAARTRWTRGQDSGGCRGAHLA